MKGTAVLKVATGRTKVVAIDGLDREEALKRLARQAGGDTRR